MQSSDSKTLHFRMLSNEIYKSQSVFFVSCHLQHVVPELRLREFVKKINPQFNCMFSRHT